MKKKYQKSDAFTLIELLIATSIFAVAILGVSLIFGSGNRLQSGAKSAIYDQRLISLISETLFSDLKSANDWGLVAALPSTVGGPVATGNFKVKGFAFLKFDPANNRLTFYDKQYDGSSSANLILAFYDLGERVKMNAYYYNQSSGILYKSTKEYEANQLPVTVANLPELQAGQITSDRSRIEKMEITGNNYLSTKSAVASEKPVYNDNDRRQPLLNVNVTVGETDSAGNLTGSRLQSKFSISGRNYLEEPW
jgi:prepilin-type N-terminal cleavage/methylation domain-containing protein